MTPRKPLPLERIREHFPPRRIQYIQRSCQALRRAETLASNSGSKVGKLRQASQGVFQITPAYSTEVSDYGVNDTSSVRKSIRAVVTVDYSIE